MCVWGGVGWVGVGVCVCVGVVCVCVWVCGCVLFCFVLFVCLFHISFRFPWLSCHSTCLQFNFRYFLTRNTWWKVEAVKHSNWMLFFFFFFFFFFLSPSNAFYQISNYTILLRFSQKPLTKIYNFHKRYNVFVRLPWTRLCNTFLSHKFRVYYVLEDDSYLIVNSTSTLVLIQGFTKSRPCRYSVTRLNEAI